MTFAAHALALFLLAAPDGGSPVALGPGERTLQGVRFYEQFPNGADRTSPLLVAIHGRGSTPEKFAEVFRGFPGKVHLALPQASTSFGPGWSWFHLPSGAMDDAVSANVALAEEQLWKAIAELAQGRKVIVMGFSQGGILSFVLAARHPEQIRWAFPIAGGAPSQLLPRAGTSSKAAPVFALHGADDDLIEVKHSRTAIAAFKQAGSTAELREYPGVGHTITQKMRDELFAQILRVLKIP